jgi:indolepyruvate ferredoxin oxidoreductase beta subunit
MDKFEMLVAGIGGQGVLLIGSILDKAARYNGFETVIGSEIHGMAQRGGPLVSYTRIGSDAHGPIISTGCADVIIGLEYIEALRNIEKLAENGSLVVSNNKQASSVMWLAGIDYPDDDAILSAMKAVTDKVKVFDVLTIAKEVGNIRTSNVALLGSTTAAVEGFPINEESLRKAIKDVLPDKLVDINLKAFDMGVEAAS